MRCVLLLTLIAACFLLVPWGAAAQQGSDTEKHGFVKDASRNHPGWECPHHPFSRSFFPMICPICVDMRKGVVVPHERKGQWTCPEHPQVSSTTPGRCPLCTAELITVQDLEKRMGKSIEEINAILRAEIIRTGEALLREYELARTTKMEPPVTEKTALSEKAVSAKQGHSARGRSWIFAFICIALVAVVSAAIFLVLKRKKGRRT